MNLVSALFSFKWLHFSGSYVLGATSCPNLPHFFLLLLEGMFLPISHIKLYLRAGAIPKSVTLILLVETGTLHLVEMDLRLGLVELGLHDHLAQHLACLDPFNILNGAFWWGEELWYASTLFEVHAFSYISCHKLQCYLPMCHWVVLQWPHLVSPFLLVILMKLFGHSHC